MYISCLLVYMAIEGRRWYGAVYTYTWLFVQYLLYSVAIQNWVRRIVVALPTVDAGQAY